MKKYDTILWDLDGTLLYTLTDLTNSVNAALTQFNQPAHSQEKVRQFVGNGIRRLMERAVPGGKNNPLFPEIFAAFKADYAKNCNNNTKPFDGIPEILQKLKTAGYRMAIVSNKIDSAVKDLADIHFSETITAAIGDNPEHNKKPAPDNVLLALEQLQSQLSHAIYIGDSEVDIMTAQNAGIPMIIVDWGYKDHDFLANAGGENIVSTPEELYEKICALQNL
ncbi:MAG: HAD family hydrolase [Bacillota bacterium]|jgi:phosphoglycolate phosphatase